MKNLNKKISAVALASMVVLGGVAANGAQSFADSKKSSLVDERNVQDDDMKELNKLIKKSYYKSGFPYEAFKYIGSKQDARNKIKRGDFGGYNEFNKVIAKVNKDNIDKSLYRFVKSGSKYFILEFK